MPVYTGVLFGTEFAEWKVFYEVFMFRIALITLFAVASLSSLKMGDPETRITLKMGDPETRVTLKMGDPETRVTLNMGDPETRVIV